MLHEQASEQAKCYGRVKISALSRKTGHDRKKHPEFSAGSN